MPNITPGIQCRLKAFPAPKSPLTPGSSWSCVGLILLISGSAFGHCVFTVPVFTFKKSAYSLIH